MWAQKRCEIVLFRFLCRLRSWNRLCVCVVAGIVPLQAIPDFVASIQGFFAQRLGSLNHVQILNHVGILTRADDYAVHALLRI